MAEPAGRNSAVNQSCDFNNFANSLMCPVLDTPLNDAVMLIPCGHTISEVAATKIYHNMRTISGYEMVETKKPCPLCRRNVQAYHPNLLVRSIVESTLGTKLEEMLPAASAVIKADEEKDFPASLTFPGRGAHFALSEKTSVVTCICSHSYRTLEKLCFRSRTHNSFFKEMSILGDEEGNVSIYIKFDQEDDASIDYLSACGIVLCPIARATGWYQSKDRITTQLLFKLLAKHNEIPGDKMPLIRNIVASGDWRTVSPPLHL